MWESSIEVEVHTSLKLEHYTYEEARPADQGLFSAPLLMSCNRKSVLRVVIIYWSSCIVLTCFNWCEMQSIVISDPQEKFGFKKLIGRGENSRCKQVADIGSKSRN